MGTCCFEKKATVRGQDRRKMISTIEDVKEHAKEVLRTLPGTTNLNDAADAIHHSLKSIYPLERFSVWLNKLPDGSFEVKVYPKVISMSFTIKES